MRTFSPPSTVIPQVPFLQPQEEVEFHGRRFLVSPDTDETRQRLRKDHANARILAGLHPRWPLADPDRVSWEEFQTPCRDQDGRGTCWAFASLAAVEARYKRQFGLELDLSEQYFVHLCRATGLRSDYLTTPQQFEACSSLWDGGGNSTSVGSLTELAAATYENDAPYENKGELESLRQSIPGIGDLAWSEAPDLPTTQEQIDLLEWDDRLIPRVGRWSGRYRVNSWHSIDFDISSLEAAIAAGHEVAIDIDVKWRFDESTDTYELDNSAGGGLHCVLLVGYDRSVQRFRMKNSWGEGRIVNVSYDFIRQQARGATVVTDVDPAAPPDRRHWWLGRWHMDHDGWRGTLVIRRWAAESAPTKLGNYYRSDGACYDVNGFMAEDGLQASFTVAPSPGRKPPGVMDGQRFDAYVFSWDRVHAAGMTTWNNIPFGVQLSRDPLPQFEGEEFSVQHWAGEWELNHDGWRGVLTIERVFPTHFPYFSTYTQVRYRSASGVEYPAEAVIHGDRQRVMDLAICFDGSWQPFTLYAHTWEHGVLSGTTVWAGSTFGAIGYKR